MSLRALASLPAVLLLAMLQTGCVVGPNYLGPSTPVPDAWYQELEAGHFLNVEETRTWWTIFNDPLLNDLIYVAGEQNLDLYAAATRIWQARAQVTIARSPRLAFLDVTGIFAHSKQSANAFGLGGVPNFILTPRDQWSLGFDVSWEPDVFGRITRQIQSAVATEQASVEAYRDVMVTLYAEVAANYVRARTLQQQLEYTRNNVEIQEQALELARKRVQGGVSPVLDEHQAESNLAITESEIPDLESRLGQAINRIDVLLGEYPGTLHNTLGSPAPIPQPTLPLPIALPCDVVRQRPDIRRAERELAVRTADIGVAVSDLYPRFSLGGTFALSSENLSTLLDEDSFTYTVGPDFRWAIFHAGQILANVAARRAATEEALAIYQQTLLIAAEEVENAVIAYNNEIERRDALKRSVEATEKSLERVLELYRSGKTNFQNVLDTQRTLFLAQNQLAISEGLVIGNLILFYKALGGGWDPAHHCVPRRVRLDGHAPTVRQNNGMPKEPGGVPPPEQVPAGEQALWGPTQPQGQPQHWGPAPRSGQASRDVPSWWGVVDAGSEPGSVVQP